jgi:tellurite resistance protein
MPELFKEVDINPDQAQAIARGLYTVAKADGYVHEREAMLIADFYAGTVEHAAQLATLEREGPVDGAYLAAHLPSKDLRELFLKTSILLSYADGNFGAQEAAVIGEFAKSLGASEQDLAQWDAQVKDYLLAQLTHLQNTDVVVDVAKGLGRS